MAKRINMELHVKDKGTPTIKKFSDNTRKQMSAIAGAVGIGALTAGFVALTKKTIAYGDKLHKLNLQLGISVEQLDKLKRVGELSGVTFEQISTAIRMMSRNLNDAAQGTGLAKDALEELNLNAEELLNMEPDKAFVKITDALSKVLNPTKKAALAMELYGRSGAVVVQMSKDLDKNLAKMNTNFNQSKADQAAEFTDTMTEFGHSMEDLATQWIPIANAALRNFATSAKWATGIIRELWDLMNEPKVVQINRDLAFQQKVLNTALRINDEIGETRARKRIKQLTDELLLIAQIRKAEQGASQDKAVRMFGKLTPSDLPEIVKPPTIQLADDSEYQAYLQKERDLAKERRELAEENERVLNEARAEGVLEQARMAEEALKKDIEIMNAEIEAEKSKIEAITKLEEEAADERKKLIERTSQYFSDNFADAFSDFASGTKKFNDAWQEMLGGMMEDLTRMLASSAFRELFGLASNTGGGGGFFSAIGGIFGFASGGSVGKGKPVMVGERGPELFVPNGNGDIVPNKSLGSNVTNNINVAVTQGSNNQSEADNQRFGKIIAEQIKDQVKAVMVDERRYGGLLNSRSY